MKSRILVADDEADVLALLESRLRASGYEVLKATEGVGALARARADAPALAILDIMMPGLSGLELCRILKGDPKTAGIAIILLTARTEEVDRVLGFEFGADDYVLKPFSPRELTLRIQAILRHRPNAQLHAAPFLRLGPVTVDRESREVSVGTRPVMLTAVEFKLLLFLMENPGRVLSRETLLNSVWSTQASIEIRTVDTHLRRLREKLGLAGACIQTIRSFGYRMEERA